MEYTNIEWLGHEGVEFTLEDYVCKLIKPKCKPNGKWVLKTHYFTAFPETERLFLERGYHLAFQTNRTSFATEDDIERKARFVKFVSKEFGLAPTCSMVGMSCGGLYAVTLTAAHPELADVLYLDAPVMNLLSICDLGDAKSGLCETTLKWMEMSMSEMLAYRDHPIDKMHILLGRDIPIVMVSGDADTVVPYHENGALLEDYYRRHGGRIRVWLKPGGDHHPHGLTDREAEVVDAIEAFSRENDAKRN